MQRIKVSGKYETFQEIQERMEKEVEAAEDENGGPPGRNPWGKPIPPVAAATAAAICEGDLNIAIGSISGLL